MSNEYNIYSKCNGWLEKKKKKKKKEKKRKKKKKKEKKGFPPLPFF
jgi:hypothetical protein